MPYTTKRIYIVVISSLKFAISFRTFFFYTRLLLNVGHISIGSDRRREKKVIIWKLLFRVLINQLSSNIIGSSLSKYIGGSIIRLQVLIMHDLYM